MGGVLIVLTLGLIAGAFFHGILRSFWIASTLATVTSAVLWVVGVYALLAISAPNELGGPLLLAPILLTFGTTFVGAVTAGFVVRMARKASHPAGCCKGCGYNLTGNVSGVCPECGLAVQGGNADQTDGGPPAVNTPSVPRRTSAGAAEPTSLPG